MRYKCLDLDTILLFHGNAFAIGLHRLNVVTYLYPRLPWTSGISLKLSFQICGIQYLNEKATNNFKACKYMVLLYVSLQMQMRKRGWQIGLFISTERCVNAFLLHSNSHSIDIFIDFAFYLQIKTTEVCFVCCCSPSYLHSRTGTNLWQFTLMATS